MKRRVLIADPDELLLAGCRAFLAAEGFEVVAVTNLPDCRAALGRSAADLLILDPELIWRLGADMQSLLGEDSDQPAVPVLLLTSRPEKVAAQTHPACCGLLIKPVSPAAVARLVRSVAEASGAVQASSA